MSFISNPNKVTERELTHFIRRLEAATERLEDIALSVPGAKSLDGAHGESSPGLPAAATSITQPDAAALPPAVADFRALTDEHLTKYVESAKALDPTIADQSVLMATAFKAQERFLLMATKAKKPDMASAPFGELLSSLQHALGAVNDIKDSNRGSPFKDHLAMVAEGTSAPSWLFENKPADYIGEVIGGVQMFGNRILKQHKER